MCGSNTSLRFKGAEKVARDTSGLGLPLGREARRNTTSTLTFVVAKHKDDLRTWHVGETGPAVVMSHTAGRHTHTHTHT